MGELVSRSGSAASFIAVWSVGVYEFGVSPGVLSLLALCNTLPRVAASMVAGRMVDRHGPRVVLLVGAGSRPEPARLAESGIASISPCSASAHRPGAAGMTGPNEQSAPYPAITASMTVSLRTTHIPFL